MNRPFEPRRARMAFLAFLVVALGLAPLASGATGVAEEAVDLAAVHLIKEEGLQASQVMELMSWLTDVYGPRLTGSPIFDMAADWAIETMESWGLENARKETWGEFGRGWTNEHFSAHVVSPTSYPLIGYPEAWTPGTEGTVRGEAVIAMIENEDDFEGWSGELSGKFVLVAPMPEVEALWEAPAHRFTAEELEARAAQPVSPPRAGGRGGPDFSAFRARREFAERRNQFFLQEGVAALLEPGRGSGGTVWVSGGGSRDAEGPGAPPSIQLAVEHYGRIFRTLEKDVPVEMEMRVDNTFHGDDLGAYNIFAEIPGTDLADEVVMLGAHFDSWHGGTGATDNAAGSAVMMEAMRILKATGLPLRRTVRIALWSGEEQGLLGSRAWVADHLADRATGEIMPAHERFSAYYNVDNGTGAIRGVYLQGNELVAPIFEAWMEPFENLGMTTLSIRDTGGTDHLAFDAVGLPGFQFIQDPVEYSSRTHHSSMDVYERIQAEDMMKNAVIVAAFVYHTANREGLLPRKPMPELGPRGGGTGGGR